MEIKIYQSLRLIFICGFLVSGSVFGQGISYKIQSGVYYSNHGETPFALRANQYGTVPYESQFFTVQGSLQKEYNWMNVRSADSVARYKRKLSFGYGVNLIANTGKVNQVLLPEAYLKVSYRFLEFYAGRRKEIFGIVDSTLSSGSYTWSGNTLPMPKLQLSTIGYVPIGKNKLFSINTGYAHGWFDNRTAIKNSYLHQKWFYVKQQLFCKKWLIGIWNPFVLRLKYATQYH